MQNLSRCFALSAALLSLAAPGAGAQQQAGAAAARMELTTRSEKARTEYGRIFPDANNLRGARARVHALAALEEDPTFGLARIHAARFNPALTNEQRGAEVRRALSDMTGASVPEVLFALYWRESIAGRAQSAQAVLRALADMVPGDPDVHFILLNARRTGAPAAEALRLDREFIARFPDYAPVYNQHSYTLWLTGDKAGAFAAARTQMRLAPDQPNTHDTYADLLILDGKYEEAIAHSNAAIGVDSGWVQGYQKIGALKLQAGAGEEARAWFRRGMAAAATPAAKADAHNWVATTYVVARDGRNALRVLDTIRAEAEEWKLPAAARALTHLRLALIEAHLGNRENVPVHLEHAAGITGAPALTQQLYASIAWATIGDAAQARSFADGYAATPNAAPATARVISALAAVTAKDFARAETELAQVTTPNLLADELRAEVMKQRGQRSEVAAAKRDILSRPVKGDNTSAVDLFKVVARLRAARL